MTNLKGSYCFSLGIYKFTIGYLGTGQDANIKLKNSPDAFIKPNKIITNAPCENFVFIHTINIGDVIVNIGGPVDAYILPRIDFDCPIIKPDTEVIIQGLYTGWVPDKVCPGSIFGFCAAFTGPSNAEAFYGEKQKWICVYCKKETLSNGCDLPPIEDECPACGDKIHGWKPYGTVT